MEKLLITEIWTIAQTNHGCVVFLKPLDMDVAVPIIIGQLELHSIIIGKEGTAMPRPLTHDLFVNVFKALDITLKQVEIFNLIDNTFHARLILEGRQIAGNGLLILDSRPSDAIALAVRLKCPIFLNRELVKKMGIPLDYFIEEIEKAASSMRQGRESRQSGHSSQPNQYQELIRQLNRAVEDEEYERAAEIRDILIQLEKKER